MADDDADKDTQSEESEGSENAGKGSKKNLIIMIVLGLVLVGLSVGGTLAALKMFGGAPSGEEEMLVEEDAEPAKMPAIYYPLKPALIITYLAKGRHRYAQVGITLMLREDDVVAAVELHKPTILNALNMIISGQVYEEVQTAEGKELLRLQCLDELQKIMQKEIGKAGIEQVLFTDFVMQ